MSHGRAIAWLAEEDPERVAVIHGAERATRRELERRSNRLARAYAERGVAKGALVTRSRSRTASSSWRRRSRSGSSAPRPSDLGAGCPSPRRAIVAIAKPALIVGAPAGEYARTAFASVPAGFEPPPAPPPARSALTWCRERAHHDLGRQHGRPKLIVDLTPALADPTVAENASAPRHDARARPLYHAGPFMCRGSACSRAGRDPDDALRARGVLRLVERTGWTGRCSSRP